MFTETLARDGILTIGQLQQMAPEDLMRRYGEMGARLAHLARGEDTAVASIATPAPNRCRTRRPS